MAVDIRKYQTTNGTIPLDDWLSDLRHKRAIARILVRLDRLALGLEGQWRAVGEGIRELKIPEGKGYRVYYGWDGPSVVVLLCGGDKSIQRADIAQAKACWSDYHERK